MTTRAHKLALGDLIEEGCAPAAFHQIRIHDFGFWIKMIKVHGCIMEFLPTVSAWFVFQLDPKLLYNRFPTSGACSVPTLVFLVVCLAVQILTRLTLVLKTIFVMSIKFRRVFFFMTSTTGFGHWQAV